VFKRRAHHHEDEHGDPHDTRAIPAETPRERYGGFNFGAAFFGWLVAVALTVLLAGVAGVVATAAGTTLDFSPSEAEQEAGTLGLAAGVTLLVILLLAYFTGGYVAGRMSRFDGGRQGLGVWVIGLLVTVAVAALGALFGTQYNVFEQVDLPSLPVTAETLGLGTVVAALAILVGTLLAAMLGGKAGQRYHRKVDRAAAAY
jgi:hypothetical protein